MRKILRRFWDSKAFLGPQGQALHTRTPSSSFNQGQADPEGGAVALVGLEADSTVELFDALAGDSQAQTRAAGLGRKVGLEDLVVKNP